MDEFILWTLRFQTYFNRDLYAFEHYNLYSVYSPPTLRLKCCAFFGRVLCAELDCFICLVAVVGLFVKIIADYDAKPPVYQCILLIDIYASIHFI